MEETITLKVFETAVIDEIEVNLHAVNANTGKAVLYITGDGEPELEVVVVDNIVSFDVTDVWLRVLDMTPSTITLLLVKNDLQ